MLNRRDAMKLGLGAWLATGVGPALAASGPKRPRYFLNVLLRGGMDGIYTLDPKVRSQVAAKVDLPYAPDGIIDAGPLQFGPHFKQLVPWAKKMAVLRGVQVRTANHESGALQMLRMKTAVSRNMPGLLDIIGEARSGQPLASVTLGRTSSLEHSPAGFVSPSFGAKHAIFDEIDHLSAGDYDAVAKAFRGHLARAEGWASSFGEQQTRAHLQQVAALFTRLPTVPKFKPVEWSKRPKRQKLAVDLQRTLWLIENDLTRGVYVKVFFDWDSHFRNAAKQTTANLDFTFVFSRFLTELSKRSNTHGKLMDNTLLVTGSELGRFPVLNGNAGKDHFPETNLIFMGAGIRPGSYVPTGELLEGTKVNLTTGKPDASGTYVVLDDVGTTLLSLAGIDPQRHGYRGRRLRFLEA